jgi:hypothetical protein
MIPRDVLDGRAVDVTLYGMPCRATFRDRPQCHVLIEHAAGGRIEYRFAMPDAARAWIEDHAAPSVNRKGTTP